MHGTKKRIALGAAGGAMALLAVTATAASAASSWHTISGTCYESGDWFTSSNVRTMGGTTIKASFNTAPSKGMAFRTINYNTGRQLGSTIYVPPLSSQTITTDGKSGLDFVGSFKLQVAGKQDNYSFDGSLYY